MKKIKTMACGLVLLALVLAACNDNGENGYETNHGTTTPAALNITAEETRTPPDPAFGYGLDENGFWSGLTARNYVDVASLTNLVVPHDVHYISEERVQAEIDGILVFFGESTPVFDRVVQDGDTINIDFVGSTGGVEFDGGSTFGMGMDVTIGVTSFIDDFLDQLIGTTPGDVVNVEVTFPDDYFEASLAGAEALFVTTINHIVEHDLPTLTDAFVQAELTMWYGWETVEEMQDALRNDLRESALQAFVNDFLLNHVTVSTIPEAALTYKENLFLANFRMGAEEWGMEFDEFVLLMADLDVEEGDDITAALLAHNQEGIEEQATLHLITQAMAEETGMVVTPADITDFFVNAMNIPDYTEFEEIYGMPFIRMMVRAQMVTDYIIANAVWAEA